MFPPPPAGAAADLLDAMEEKPSFEFAETADVAATVPAPTLRKSRRVVFISTPPGDQPAWNVNQCFLGRFWNRDFFDWQHRRGSELSKNAALSFRWYSWVTDSAISE